MKIIKVFFSIVLLNEIVIVYLLHLYFTGGDVQNLDMLFRYMNISQLLMVIVMTMYAMGVSRKRIFGLLILVPIIFPIFVTWLFSYLANDIFMEVHLYLFYLWKLIEILFAYILLKITKGRMFVFSIVYTVLGILNSFVSIPINSSLISSGVVLHAAYNLGIMFVINSKYEFVNIKSSYENDGGVLGD